MAFLTKT